MNYEIMIDNLTENSVSVKKQRVTVIDGIKYTIGKPSRKGYVNSTKGRNELQNDLEEKYYKCVFELWGDIPTVIEKDVTQ